MRARDFLIVEAQGELFEVKMSPSSLKKLASQIPARVGIEFEMIVPDVGSVDDDDEGTEDMSMDESAVDIDDICSFFEGDYNDRSTIRELRDELQEKYWEWQSEQVDESWSNEGKQFFAKWCHENIDPDDVADQVDTPEDLLGDRIPSKEDWEKFIEEEWEEAGYNYDKAFDEYREEKLDEGDFDEREFLRSLGIYDMSDVSGAVRTYVSWPHWEFGGGDADYNLEQLADEFSDVIGRKVHYSTGYHGGPRTDDAYTIEPDSSLSGSGDDAGLEFISPPLPIDEALDDVKKIKEWADDRGVYTNRSTGLHMNISVPGFDPEKLDFVKLTLLLGDKYLLDRFGRGANTYCKSAMDIISEAPSVQDKELLFKKLKSNLETMASKVIHSGRVGKFTSINPKDNRVEFRGPGGDWLGQNFDRIEETLYRCVVALDAAVDPDKYRKEYLKKLTKMFAPTKGSLEDVFLQYAAGTITREELKFKLKTAQASRKQEKFTAQGIVEVPIYQARDGDWIVEYDNPNGKNHRIMLKRTEQVRTDQQALEAAIQLEPSWFKPDDIENILVTEFTGNHIYVVHGNDPDKRVEINAFSPMQAIEIALDMYPNMANQGELTAKLASDFEDEPENLGSSPRMGPGEQMFTVVNNTTNQSVNIAAVDSATALSRALRNNPSWDSYHHQIRVLAASPTQRETGSTYNLYRVRGNGNSEYVSARSVGEAGRIALTAFPNLGDRVDDLDIVLQDADPNVVGMYLRAQQSEIDRRNNVRGRLGQPEPAFTNPNAGMDSYIVSEPDGAGQVRFRANSPEHAIERARAAFSLPPERELVARLDDGR